VNSTQPTVRTNGPSAKQFESIPGIYNCRKGRCTVVDAVDGREGRLFHTQIILYGSGPLDAPCDLTRFNDGVLRANPAAQYDNATTGFNADVE